jgi:hypothetical protein
MSFCHSNSLFCFSTHTWGGNFVLPFEFKFRNFGQEKLE